MKYGYTSIKSYTEITVSKIKLLKIVSGTLVVFAFAFCFARNYTFSSFNKFSWTPDWFSGNAYAVPCPTGAAKSEICETTQLYNSIGWPIQVPGSATGGLFWLAHTINYAVLALLAGGLTILVIKRYKLGILLGLGLMLLTLLIPAR